MCLLVVIHRVLEDVPLVVAANRDELYARPADAMTTLSGASPRIVGGRDLSAGGTWMATNEHGVMAALTNTPSSGRDPSLSSRGELPLLLARSSSAGEAVEGLADRIAGRRYGPCWIFVADREALFYVDMSISGRSPSAQRLDPGVCVLENRPLFEPSAKVDRVRALLGDIEGPRGGGDTGATLDGTLERLLGDRVVPEGEPPTSALRVETSIYGTRSSSIVRVARAGVLPEVRYLEGSPASARWQTARWPPSPVGC